MAPRTLYEILGLGITADVHDIKLAYRQLANEYHPDKNTTPQATALFQDLNQAYHTLTNATLRAEYDLSIGISEPRAHMNHDDNVSHMALPDLDFKIRENMMSVTIDVTDIMFLAFVEQCEHHYDIAPIDRGHHGLQFRFDYRSPNEDEHYGSISLTFYPSTARLHVQGSSYLLWVEEHLPSIYANTETRFSSQISKWAYLSRQRGIGWKRESRRQRSSVDLALTTSAAPSESPGPTPTAAVCMPAVTTSLTAAPVVPTQDLAATPHAAAASSMHADSPTVTASTAITAVAQNTMVSITSPGGTTGGTPDDIQSPDVSNSIAATHLLSVAASPPDATTSTDSDAATATIHQPAENATQSTGCTRATRQASKSATPAVDSVKPAKAKKEARKTKPKKVKKDSPDHHPTHHTNSQPCQPGCHVSATDAKDMIRCSLCMVWFHNVCVGEDRRYVGVWTCVSCRCLPAVVLNLQTQVNALASSLAAYQHKETAQNDEINRLKSDNNRLMQKVNNLQNTNSDLTKLIETMSDTCISTLNMAESSSDNFSRDASISVPTTNKFDVLSKLPGDDVTRDSPRRSQDKRVRFAEVPRQTVRPVSVTVVGSSIVRGVAPVLNQSKEYSVDGFVFPSRTAKQINSTLKSIPKSDITVVAAGSNNIEGQPVKDCVDQVRQVVDNISRKRHNRTVIMCQIPHRCDKPYLNQKIDDVNSRIAKEIKRYNNVHILEHSVVKDDFKKDLLHFNERGVTKFALQIRHEIRKLSSPK